VAASDKFRLLVNQEFRKDVRAYILRSTTQK
jgi:hypothetical protein